MKQSTKELIEKIRQHRGEVCVCALMRDDIFYVKVVKGDLIDQIRRGDRGDALSFDVKDGTAYVDVNH